jgi:hypothetical protein
MSYAVVWSENGGPLYAGRLDLKDRYLVLEGTAAKVSESGQKVFYDELGAVTIGHAAPDRLRGRRALLLTRRTGARVQIVPLQTAGALPELAERLAAARGKAAARIGLDADARDARCGDARRSNL